MFFVWQNGTIVLLHTFSKKSQKTPVQEIRTALRKKQQWEKDFSSR
ncbi:type II toxin-antitoxin system RelE/ParE family toxin [Selenomonas sputigena]